MLFQYISKLDLEGKDFIVRQQTFGELLSDQNAAVRKCFHHCNVCMK